MHLRASNTYGPTKAFVGHASKHRVPEMSHGVATISRLLQMIGLFCRILSLLKGSFAKETYDLKACLNICVICICEYMYIYIYMIGEIGGHVSVWAYQTCIAATIAATRLLLHTFVAHASRHRVLDMCYVGLNIYMCVYMYVCIHICLYTYMCVSCICDTRGCIFELTSNTYGSTEAFVGHASRHRIPDK